MYKRIKDSYLDNKSKKTREYAEIYVDDKAEALSVSTDDYIQGSKMYIIESAELYILHASKGIWCSADDGHALA